MAYTPSTPGPQNPQKYGGNVGAAYRQYGEQPGWIYYPPLDKYYLDPGYAKTYGQQQGYIPPDPKKPGLGDTVLPIAAAGGALALGQGLGKDPTAFLGGIGDAAAAGASKLGGMFGLGGGSSAASAGASSLPSSAITSTPEILGSGSGMVGDVGVAQAAAAGLPTDIASGGTAATQATAGLGSAALPIAGGAAGAFGLYDEMNHGGQYSPVRGTLQGAASGAALGASIGSAFGGVGAVPGAIIGGVAGGAFGLGESLFGDKDQWKTEKNRLNKLQDNGTYIPPNLIDQFPTKGRSKEQLMNNSVAPDFVGYDSSGNWVNNKFAQSRNEADLKPMDIVNYSAFAEHDPDWFKKPLQDRLDFAQQVLNSGAVRESKGSISVDFDKLGSAQAPAQQQQGAAPITQNLTMKPVMSDGRTPYKPL